MGPYSHLRQGGGGILFAVRTCIARNFLVVAATAWGLKRGRPLTGSPRPFCFVITSNPDGSPDMAANGRVWPGCPRVSGLGGQASGADLVQSPTIAFLPRGEYREEHLRALSHSGAGVGRWKSWTKGPGYREGLGRTPGLPSPAVHVHDAYSGSGPMGRRLPSYTADGRSHSSRDGRGVASITKCRCCERSMLCGFDHPLPPTIPRRESRALLAADDRRVPSPTIEVLIRVGTPTRVICCDSKVRWGSIAAA